MQLEQTAARKKLIRSDGLLFVLVIVSILLISSFLGYMERVLQQNTQVLQFVAYFALAAACYAIVHWQITSFRYVLTDKVFVVYRRIGRRESMAERVHLSDMLFVAPYTEAPGIKGREFALCAGAKRGAFVLAHRQNDRLQWLIVSIDEAMQKALRQAMAASAQEENAAQEPELQ